MAAHSSILAWKIPWTEESGRLQSMGSQRVRHDWGTSLYLEGFPHNSLGKESACNAGDPGLFPGWGRSPGEENGNSLQYSCLENPMGRGAWWAPVHGVVRVRHDLVTKPPPPHLKHRKYIEKCEQPSNTFQNEQVFVAVCVSHSVVSDLLWPYGLYPPGSSRHRILRQDTGGGCHSLLQRIFPTQGSNPGLLHCRQTLYCVSHNRAWEGKKIS